MAIKSIKDLPRGKRATAKQVESAIKAKPIERKGKSVGRIRGRLEYGFGKIKKDEAAGIVKGFRRKYKADFGAIVKDVDGNVIARTHIAKGTTTIPEQLIVKALSKYGKKYDEIQLVLSVVDSKTPKKPAKKTAKKPVKKPVKKAVKKPAKKAAKKPAKKATRKK